MVKRRVLEVSNDERKEFPLEFWHVILARTNSTIFSILFLDTINTIFISSFVINFPRWFIPLIILESWEIFQFLWISGFRYLISLWTLKILFLFKNLVKIKILIFAWELNVFRRHFYFWIFSNFRIFFFNLFNWNFYI